MRDRGYLTAVVEKWNPYMRRDESGESHGGRQDLFGFVDVIAVGDNEVLAIQVTTLRCMTERLRKIRSHENLRPVRRGMKVFVHGWRKFNGRWRLKEVEVP